jgi:hypothetical protein
MTAVLPPGTLPNNRRYGSVDIANGASLSDALNLAGHTLVGIIMPSSWTSANLTFQASHDGTTYSNLFDDAGNEQTVTAAASEYLFLSPLEWVGIAFLKVRSGTSGSPVNQGGARTITLVMAP